MDDSSIEQVDYVFPVGSELLEGEAWEKQVGEPMMWFERFEVYLQMGQSRSLVGCYRKVMGIAVQDGRRRRTLPGSWRRAAVRYRWVERAEAFERAEAAAMRKEMEKFHRRLTGLTEAAIETLEGVMQGGNPVQARLAAASILFFSVQMNKTMGVSESAAEVRPVRWIAVERGKAGEEVDAQAVLNALLKRGDADE